VLIVDTGVLLAAADSADPDHDSCAALIGTESGLLIASPLVIAEATYLIGRQLGARAEAAFVRAVAADEIVMEQLTKSDLERVATLVDQYVDLSLGATDASVIALAERHGEDTIATLDRRHFSVVRSAAGSAFELVP
jgi:predicted nucleic acid-binding protein